ncbi:MAG: hypothetical protein ABSG10_01200 [Terracidiphilus sp.]
MEAMIFHAASIVAFFVNSAATSPVQIQCAQQPAPESWVKWLLPALVQTIVSLASIGAGVAIAVWSFRKNRQSEHEQWVRTQRAAHEEWTRDQKRIEWKGILQVVSEIEIAIPAVSRIQERYDLISKNLPAMIAQLLGALGSCVFIRESIDREESRGVLERFATTAAGAAEYLQGFDARTETDPAIRQSCQRKSEEIRNEYLRLRTWLHEEARRDICGATPSS